jgi:outer membrane protein
MMVGVGAEYKPNFEGEKGGRFGPMPIFFIHRAGAAEQFHGLRDGASIASIIYRSDPQASGLGEHTFNTRN